jgi:hypothetical protein
VELKALSDRHTDRERMSYATKIVLGTVGLSALLVVLLIAVAAFG